MPETPTAERQARHRLRKRLGLVPVTVWVRPERVAEVEAMDQQKDEQ